MTQKLKVLLVFTALASCSGCVSLSALWPFKSQTPLEKVQATQVDLSGVNKQLNEIQQAVAQQSKVFVASDTAEWQYVTKISTGLDIALADDSSPTGAVARLYNSDILRLAQSKAPVSDNDIANIKSITEGLLSSVQSQIDTANDKLNALNGQVTAAERINEAAKAQVIELNKQAATLQVRQADLTTQLSNSTQQAIKQDDVKDQMLKTYNDIKFWFWFTIIGGTILLAISHFHLLTLIKTLAK